MKRESHYTKVARIAYQLAQRVLPRYTHPKSPHHYTQPQLAACVLMMFYMRLSYRDMEEWLLASDQVCQTLGLTSIPDHSTLSRMMKRLRMWQLVLMNRLLLSALKPQPERLIGMDATGYSPIQASAYYRTVRKRGYTRWVKGVYAVGIDSQLILAWRQGLGPGTDDRYMNGLRRDVRRYARYEKGKRDWHILADKGFDSAAHEDDFVPPIRRGRKFTGWMNPLRTRRAERVAAARLDGIMGQRWICETVHSVIKRKFGDACHSRKRSLQRLEPAIFGLIYNIHR